MMKFTMYMKYESMAKGLTGIYVCYNISRWTVSDLE